MIKNFDDARVDIILTNDFLTNDFRITKKFVKKFLLTMISIDETRIASTNEKIFVKNFHDIKIFDVVTSKNELTTINLTMINDNETTNDEFAKDFRFNIIIVKLYLTKNLYDKKAMRNFCYLIN